MESNKGQDNTLECGLAMAEVRILVACWRRFLNNGAQGEIRDLIQDVNWSSLTERARAHGLIPLLHWVVKQDCPDAIPEDLHTEFRANARNNLNLTAELLKIVALLHGRGVDAISLKGPVLAVQAYGNLCL